MAQLIAVNGQLYCGRCNEMAGAECDTTYHADTMWLAAKDARPEYRGPPRPSAVIECLGCGEIGNYVITRMGIDVYHELIWTWLACLEGL